MYREKKRKYKQLQSQYNELQGKYMETLAERSELAYAYDRLLEKQERVRSQDEEIRKLHKSARMLKHDMRNHLMVLSSYLTYGIMILFFAALNIYLLETGSLKEVFYWNARRFAGYPVSIFHKAVQVCLIYVVPFAFVNYFPAQFLLRKPDMQQFPEVFLYITPVVGVGMYLLAYLFWRYSLRYYKSSGN